MTLADRDVIYLCVVFSQTAVMSFAIGLFLGLKLKGKGEA